MKNINLKLGLILVSGVMNYTCLAQDLYYFCNSNSTRRGFFSYMYSVLGFLDFLEEQHAAGEVSFNSDIYFDPAHGPNWWEYNFEPIQVQAELKECGKHQTFESNFKSTYVATKMPLARIKELYNRHIHPKPHIKHQLEIFKQRHFHNKKVIGVHYRGTDKQLLEATPIDYETVIQAIKDTIKKLQLSNLEYSIFVATDEQKFLDAMTKEFPTTVYQQQVRRSTNHAQPIHIGMQNPYQETEAAILDFLLLQQAHILIRTSSSLSFIASAVSPTLEQDLLLNQSTWGSRG